MSETNTERRVPLSPDEARHVQKLLVSIDAQRNALVGVLNYIIDQKNLPGEWTITRDGTALERVGGDPAPPPTKGRKAKE